VWKIILKTCDFIDISNMAISTALGGLTATSPPIMVVILRQQLAYLYILDCVYAAPDKSKIFLFQESIIIYFRRTRHSGAPP
jgi:hypothetical protein